jgi:hypothetical protein
MAEELKCSCENPKRGLPFCFGPPAPDFYVGIPEAERAKRSLLDTDLCVIDKEHHFIRGRRRVRGEVRVAFPVRAAIQAVRRLTAGVGRAT